MTTVNVGPNIPDVTHDISLTDGTDTYGLIFMSGVRALDEIPLSPPAQNFEAQQKTFVGGHGRTRFTDDPTGFSDGAFLWSSQDTKLFQGPQWRFWKGAITLDENLPDDASNMDWWKLYGTADAVNLVGRYLDVPFTSNGQTADKGYMWVRRRGTPVSNLLTLELCSDSAGNPNTVLQTVTKTVSDITDTLSIYQLFDWTGTQALTGATVYHVKIYGGSGDTAANHWEVLVDTDGSAGLMSTAGSVWTSSGVDTFFRITPADISRQWRYFLLDGVVYACSQNDDGSTSLLKTNGVRGTATSATGTTLTDSNLAMTTNQYAASTGTLAAYIRIIDGLGDGQVRQIISNTTTQFTVAAWNITPDTTSRYHVYSTPFWNTTTGTSGLGAITGRPSVAGKVAYFPQGSAVNIRRMVVAATSHTFAADGTNRADVMYAFTNTAGGVLMYKALSSTSTINSAPTGTNPLVFGGSKVIGTTDFRINNMIGYNSVLHILKEDGPYSLESSVRKLGTGFDDAPDSQTGLGACVQENYLWFGWNHSVERMLSSSAVDMLNWRSGYEGVPTDQRGAVSCMISGIGWVFMVIDGGSSNYSTVRYWNGMGWSVLFKGWATGVRIRNIFWQANVGARPRLWMDVNGEMVYMDLPLYAANPLRDTGMNYMHEAVMVTSTIDQDEPQFYKLIHELKIITDELGSFGSVEVDYQTNEFVGTSTWTSLGTASDSPFQAITANLGNVLSIRFRLRLQTKVSKSPTIVTSWQCNGWFLPPLKYQWTGTFRMDSNADTYTGENDHDPNTLVTWLLTQATQMKKITIASVVSTLDSKVVTVSAPQISRNWINTDENTWGGQISMVFREA